MDRTRLSAFSKKKEGKARMPGVRGEVQTSGSARMVRTTKWGHCYGGNALTFGCGRRVYCLTLLSYRHNSFRTARGGRFKDLPGEIQSRLALSRTHYRVSHFNEFHCRSFFCFWQPKSGVPSGWSPLEKLDPKNTPKDRHPF